MTDTPYTDKFFAHHEKGSRDSALATIPVLFEFVRPASVVDVGCGSGEWLGEFKAAGVSDTVGIDGDYVDRAKLSIEPDRFLARDLTQPFALDRRFDLAVSLEVAEHLPEASADGFVASLARLAPIVLFSAAIPDQGGTGHVNEQWPEYWSERFERHGYVAVDCLRPRLWNNEMVNSSYRQNMLVFVERSRLNDYPAAAAVFAKDGPDRPLAVVHPAFYREHNDVLWSAIRASQRQVLRATLKLRETSILVFPDWSLPEGELCGQLRALLAAMAAHPERGALSLVIYIGAQSHDSIRALSRQVGVELAASHGPMLAQGPEVATVDNTMDANGWRLLRECTQWRAALSREDSMAIARVGADTLPSVSLAEIEARISLSRK